jgi:hypothetical protein
MKQAQAQHPALEQRPLTTEQFAILVGVLPQTLRRAVCTTGSYFGVRPVKLPNRRLVWPHNSLELLAGGV